MTDSFQLNYPEDGDILYGGSLRENLSFALVTSLNYSLDDVTVTSQDNLINLTYADYDSSNSNTCLSYQKIFAQDVYDVFNSSIDATKWTDSGGNTSETTTYIRVTGNSSDHSLISKGSGSGFNLKGANNAVKFYCAMNNSTNDSRLSINDNAGNNVAIADSTGASPAGSGYYEIVANNSGETCNVWKDGVQIQTDLDISSCANWYIRIGAITSGQTISLYQFGKVTVATTYNCILDNQTIDGTIFVSSSIHDDSNATATFNWSINNGSAYTAYTNKTMVEPTTFTQLKHKISYAYTSIDVDNENVAEVEELAYYYS